MFGAILLAVVAVAVTALAGPGIIGAMQGVLVGGATAGTAAATAGMVAGGIVGGAITGAASSIVSQGIGVATGIQDKFSWKGVALSALSAAVSGGIAGFGQAAKVAEAAGKTLNGVGKAANFLNGTSLGSGLVRGAVSNALTQGIGTVVGLQSKFSFAGVAAAAVGGGIGNLVGGDLPSLSRDSSVGNALAHLGTSAASSIANAATRSAVEGSSLGRNIVAAIPDVVGQALGGAIGRGLGVLAKAREHLAPPIEIKSASAGDLPSGMKPTYETRLENGADYTAPQLRGFRDEWLALRGQYPDRDVDYWSVYWDRQATAIDAGSRIGSVAPVELSIASEEPLTMRATGAELISVPMPVLDFPKHFEVASQGYSNWLLNGGAGVRNARLAAASDLAARQSAAQRQVTYQIATFVAAPAAAGLGLTAAASAFGSAKLWAYTHATKIYAGGGVVGEAVVGVPITTPVVSGAGVATVAAAERGVGANKAAGDAIRDLIAAREAPALIEQSFNTVGGARRVDVLKLADETLAIESKVGRTSLGVSGSGSRVRQELARDWWLRKQGQVSGVRWEFTPSGVTGEVGPTAPLLEKLNKLGFEVRINP